MTNIDAHLGRELMKDELETTNKYEAMAEQASPAVAEVIRDVADEEKVHAGEGAAIVAGADPRAKPAMLEGVEEARSIMKFEDMLRKSNEDKDRERGYPPMSNTQLMRDPYRHVEMQYNDQANVNGNKGEHIDSEGSEKSGDKYDGASGSYDKDTEPARRKLKTDGVSGSFDKAVTRKNYGIQSFESMFMKRREIYKEFPDSEPPSDFDWFKFHQDNAVEDFPEYKDVISDADTDSLLRDTHGYLMDAFHGNGPHPRELEGAHGDLAEKIMTGPEGRSRWIEDVLGTEEDRGVPWDDDEKGLLGRFDALQAKHGKPKAEEEVKTEEKVEEKPIQKAGFDWKTGNQAADEMEADIAEYKALPKSDPLNDPEFIEVLEGMKEHSRSLGDSVEYEPSMQAADLKYIAQDTDPLDAYEVYDPQQIAVANPPKEDGKKDLDDLRNRAVVKSYDKTLAFAKSMHDEGKLSDGEFNAIMKGIKGIISTDADRKAEPLTEDDAINSAAIDVLTNTLVNETDELLEEMPASPRRDELEQKIWDENVPPSEEEIAGVVDMRIDDANEGKADWPKKV